MSGGCTKARPVPWHVAHVPAPPQFRHFGSASLRWVFVPVPLQSAHFPSPWQSAQTSRGDIVSPSPKVPVLHRATSSTSSLADFTESSLSATTPTAASIELRVVSSVQHHNAAFPSSG